MIFKRLKQGLALSLVALLAACGSSTPSATSPGGSSYLLTVKLEASDTQESIAQHYGGEVIAWMGDKAILKMTSEAVAQMQARGVSLQNTTLEGNPEMVAPPVTAWGWNAWGSGWNAWSSGWNAWSGGWNAWSSGVGSAAPSENNIAWDLIKLREAHAISRKFGQGVKVAVIDTGIDITHPMFLGRLAPSSEWYDFRSGDANPEEKGTNTDAGYGHGTAVASIILQIAPKATILPIRVLGFEGRGDTDFVISAIYWAVQKGANVINLSLGTYTNVSALKTAVDYAISQGVYIIASSGNDGEWSTATYPAMWSVDGRDPSANYMLMSVASSSSSDSPSAFSNIGAPLQYFAPGEQIRGAYPGNQTANSTGTSFAAPLFAGAVALALSETPRANWGSVGRVIYNTTDGIGWLEGRLNIETLIRGLPGWTQPVYNIVNLNSNRCLQISSSSLSDGAGVSQASCTISNNHRWRLSYAGGFYRLTNVNSGKVVEVTSSSTADGAATRQWGSSSSNNQQWTLRPMGSTYELVVRHSNKCLAISNSSLSDGATAVQWTCNSSNNQKWRLQLVN